MNHFTLAACLLLTAASAFALDDTDITRKSFKAAAKLEVRNTNGLIRVTVSKTANVQLVATRKVRADDRAALDDARNEVKLDVQETDGLLRLCVMQRSDDCRGNGNRDRSWSDQHYSARYDLELQIPANTQISLLSVNGSIEATELEAPCQIKTVNGAIKLSFAKVPAAAISAKTVNGTISAAFPKTLNATLRFKSFRGEVFTDFATTLPAGSSSRLTREFAVTVGSGGPTHAFETLNGRIQIAQR